MSTYDCISKKGRESYHEVFSLFCGNGADISRLMQRFRNTDSHSHINASPKQDALAYFYLGTNLYS
jgi:hypothetical protein